MPQDMKGKCIPLTMLHGEFPYSIWFNITTFLHIPKNPTLRTQHFLYTFRVCAVSQQHTLLYHFPPAWRVFPRFSWGGRQSCWQMQHRSVAHHCSCAYSDRCLQWHPISLCMQLSPARSVDVWSHTPPGGSPVSQKLIIVKIHCQWLHMTNGNGRSFVGHKPDK